MYTRTHKHIHGNTQNLQRLAHILGVQHITINDFYMHEGGDSMWMCGDM